MINLIEVRTSQGALLGLPLDDVSNGIVVEEVEGLDPVNAVLVSSSFAQMDGEQYQSSRRERRDVNLKLSLEADFVENTVYDIRKRLYGFFMPKSEIELRFYMADGLVVSVMGRVETFDAPLFVSEPKATISVACFDPDFYATESTIFTGNTVSTDTETLVPYVGSVETGIEFTLNVNRPISGFTIYHRPPDGSLRSLEFQAPLSTGDVLTISTVPGAKGATLTQSGQDGSILYGISPQSNWIELMSGDNYIRVYAEGAAIPFTIEYTNKYGGL